MKRCGISYILAIYITKNIKSPVEFHLDVDSISQYLRALREGEFLNNKFNQITNLAVS